MHYTCVYMLLRSRGRCVLDAHGPLAGLELDHLVDEQEGVPASQGFLGGVLGIISLYVLSLYPLCPGYRNPSKMRTGRHQHQPRPQHQHQHQQTLELFLKNMIMLRKPT